MMIEDLIGKPWHRGGRGPDVYDCAGLVVELMRRNGWSMEIPSSGDEEFDGLAITRILRSQWIPIPRPIRGCLVFVKPAHVGVMLDTRRVIHCTEKSGQVCIEMLDAPHIHPLVGGFYDYAGVSA